MENKNSDYINETVKFAVQYLDELDFMNPTLLEKLKIQKLPNINEMPGSSDEDKIEIVEHYHKYYLTINTISSSSMDETSKILKALSLAKKIEYTDVVTKSVQQEDFDDTDCEIQSLIKIQKLPNVNEMTDISDKNKMEIVQHYYKYYLVIHTISSSCMDELSMISRKLNQGHSPEKSHSAKKEKKIKPVLLIDS